MAGARRPRPDGIEALRRVQTGGAWRGRCAASPTGRAAAMLRAALALRGGAPPRRTRLARRCTLNPRRRTPKQSRGAASRRRARLSPAGPWSAISTVCTSHATSCTRAAGRVHGAVAAAGRRRPERTAATRAADCRPSAAESRRRRPRRHTSCPALHSHLPRPLTHTASARRDPPGCLTKRARLERP